MRVNVNRLVIQVEGSLDIQMDTPKAAENNKEAANVVNPNNDSQSNLALPKDTSDGKTDDKGKTEDGKAEDPGKAEEGEKERGKNMENQNIGSNERRMTREEELNELRKRVNAVQDALRVAGNADDIGRVISNINGILKDIEQDSNLGTFVHNLSGDVRALSLHDITRNEMDRSLQTLVEAISSAIEKEKEKEQVKKLEQIFLGLASNAEAIYAAVKKNGNSDFLKLF